MDDDGRLVEFGAVDRRVMVDALRIYSSEHAEQLAERYASTASWHLYGYEQGEQLVGVIGIEPRGASEGEIRHIATSESHRLRGVGRWMIDEAAGRHGLVRVEAETDRDAVGFYEACGFEVESLGELYPGTERFRCVRRAD